MVGRRSGRGTPSLRTAPPTAPHDNNRQGLHLTKAKQCLDEAGHLCLQPWEPWPARRAAALFLHKLRELDGAAYVEAPADLTAAIGREATLARRGAAFSRLPPGTRRRCARPLTGNSLSDTFVFVEVGDISQQHLEGVVVDGERDEDGAWMLDGEFTVFTTDEELVRIMGWACTVEVQ